MLSKIRQRVGAAGQSLAGDGMLLRLRNASIALVAAVAAVGLGLTLFISQLGFPAVFSSPIPGNPTEAGRVHDAIALTHSPAAGSSSPVLSARSAAPAPAHQRRTVRRGGDKGRGGSDQIAVSPGAQSSPAAKQPAKSVPVSAPAAPPTESSPSVPAPTPGPAVVESPSQSSTVGSKEVSDGKAKPSAPSTAKAISDGNGKSGTSPSGKSKDHQTSKDSGRTASPAKPDDSAAEKAAQDQDAAAPKPVAPAATPAPETAGPAAAKEAADSGKSDGPRH